MPLVWGEFGTAFWLSSSGNTTHWDNTFSESSFRLSEVETETEIEDEDQDQDHSQDQEETTPSTPPKTAPISSGAETNSEDEASMSSDKKANLGRSAPFHRLPPCSEITKVSNHFVCSDNKCTSHYMTKPGLRNHIVNVHKVEVYWCGFGVCVWIFTSREACEAHRALHETLGSWVDTRKCPHCNLFQEAHKDHQHQKICPDNPNVVKKCKYCSRILYLNDKEAQLKHLTKDHKQLGSNWCRLCEDPFSSLTKLRTHLRKKHNITSTEY